MSSRQLISGESPPCTHRNCWLSRAARGRQSKASIQASYTRSEYLILPANPKYGIMSHLLIQGILSITAALPPVQHCRTEQDRSSRAGQSNVAGLNKTMLEYRVSAAIRSERRVWRFSLDFILEMRALLSCSSVMEILEIDF